MNVESGEQPSRGPLFARVDGLPWRAIGDRVVVGSGPDEYRELGGLAMPVWVLLDELRSVASVADELVEVLPEAPDDVVDRVADALDGLVGRGLVRRISAESAGGADGDDSAGDGTGPSMKTRPAGGDPEPGEGPGLEPSAGPGAEPPTGSGVDPSAEPVTVRDDHEADPAESADERTGDGLGEKSTGSDTGKARGGLRFRRSASVDPDSAASRSVEAVLRSLVAFDLSASERLSDGAWGDDAAMGLVARAAAGRLTGPLLWAALTDRIDLPAEAVAELTDRHRAALLWCLHLERQLFGLLDLLADRGIRPVVLKGPAAAHLDRADPSLRTFADLDLLVRPEDIDATVALLLAEGGTRPWPQRRPGFDRRFAKSVTITLPDGVEIDLHRNLCDGVHGFRVPVDELHGDAETMDLAGRSVAVLRREHRMLHAAYHAVLGSSRPALHNLADLAVHLQDPSVDKDEVVATADRWRGTAVLAAAVDATEAGADLDGPVWDRWRTWRAGLAVDEGEWAIVEGQRRDGSSFGRTRLAAIRELPSRSEQFAYARALLWPTRDHLRARGRRRGDLVRSIGRRLFRSG